MTSENLDLVAIYGNSRGLDVRLRTVIVEGTTDVDLFHLAARLEHENSGTDLFADDFAIVAAGERKLGGATGVIRELNPLIYISRAYLSPTGSPLYRFVGLVDNDSAGRNAIAASRNVDQTILEYKDTFRLVPKMPLVTNLDPGQVRQAFETENQPYSGLDWEIEDLLPGSFMDAFTDDHPDAILKVRSMDDRVHRKLTTDGKADLHRYVRRYAVHSDLSEVIQVLRALRILMGRK